MQKKLAIVIGTRPEIIKTAPVIKLCIKREIPFYIIHTGQHYTDYMDGIFFRQLNIPEPDFCLEVGSGTHGEQTARILEAVEKNIKEEKPEAILVQGDTNSVLASSLAASKTEVKIGHIEAGLRSFDRSMPEEINRVIADHLSHYLFAPTETSRKNLLDEGIEKNVSVTGNTIVEALKENISISEKIAGQKFLNSIGVEREKYILLTLHRQENVDSKERFSEIVEGIDAVAEKTGLPVIFPVHPRTTAKIREFNLRFSSKKVKMVEPIGYFEFLSAEQGAALILTDSGGIQEEACIMKIPCVTLRENTERPETVATGGNILAGWQKESIKESAQKMLVRKKEWKNPFGEGNASRKILEIICNTN